MSGIPPSPRFFQQPIRYMKWASINKPAYFYSIMVGCAGPIMVVTVPPIRRYMGEEQIPKIPMTYPGTWRMANHGCSDNCWTEERETWRKKTVH